MLSEIRLTKHAQAVVTYINVVVLGSYLYSYIVILIGNWLTIVNEIIFLTRKKKERRYLSKSEE